MEFGGVFGLVGHFGGFAGRAGDVWLEGGLDRLDMRYWYEGMEWT